MLTYSVHTILIRLQHSFIELVDKFLLQAIEANYEKHLFQGSSIDDGSKRQGLLKR